VVISKPCIGFQSKALRTNTSSVPLSSGIASGIGTASYGAQLVVHAEDSAAAVELATAEFVAAAARAGLPSWPIARAEALSEADDAVDLDDVGEAG